MIALEIDVNGAKHRVDTWPMARLLDVLREDCKLTGTKEGCGEGECGACSVMIDGQLVNSCLVPVAQVVGKRIQTIEGVAPSDAAHPQPGLGDVQLAFLTHGGAQCGICTPGMIMATLELLEKHPEPTDDQIKEGLSGNLCRCTGYIKIFDAVREAARRVVDAKKDEARWVGEGGAP